MISLSLGGYIEKDNLVSPTNMGSQVVPKVKTFFMKVALTSQQYGMVRTTKAAPQTL